MKTIVLWYFVFYPRLWDIRNQLYLINVIGRCFDKSVCVCVCVCVCLCVCVSVCTCMYDRNNLNTNVMVTFSYVCIRKQRWSSRKHLCTYMLKHSFSNLVKHLAYGIVYYRIILNFQPCRVPVAQQHLTQLRPVTCSRAHSVQDITRSM